MLDSKENIRITLLRLTLCVLIFVGNFISILEDTFDEKSKMYSAGDRLKNVGIPHTFTSQVFTSIQADR